MGFTVRTVSGGWFTAIGERIEDLASRVLSRFTGLSSFMRLRKKRFLVRARMFESLRVRRFED